MFEHLSSKARKALKLADKAAKQLGQDYIGTEHILLGIMMEDTGRGAQELKANDLSLDRVRDHIKQMTKKNADNNFVIGRRASTPHLQHMVATAIEQAQKLKHPVICTEHLLLALLKEKGSVAYAALEDLDVKLPKLRKALSKQTTTSTCDEA